MNLIFTFFQLVVLALADDPSILIDNSCVKIPQLGNYCIYLALDSCQASLHVNITIDGSVIFSYDLSSLPDAKQCQETGPCTTCLGFDANQWVLTPSYAKICAQVTEDCQIASTSKDLGCMELGAACIASGCDNCTAIPGCGYCANSTIYGAEGRCLPLGMTTYTEPYCATCAPPSLFYNGKPNSTICPVKPEPATMPSISTEALVGVVVGVVGGVIILIAFVCCWKKRVTATPVLEMDDKHSTQDYEAPQTPIEGAHDSTSQQPTTMYAPMPNEN